MMDRVVGGWYNSMYVMYSVCMYVHMYVCTVTTYILLSFLTRDLTQGSLSHQSGLESAAAQVHVSTCTTTSSTQRQLREPAGK